MAAAFGGVVLGLVAGVHGACAQDIAAQPAYPLGETDARPVTKPASKPAAKPKPAAVHRVAHARVVPAVQVVLPPPRPTTVRVASAPPLPEVQRDDVSRVAVAPASTADDDPLANVPAAERAAVRAALLWSGGGDETPGDSLLAAIKAYQKRNKAKVTGILSDAEREDLIAAAKNHTARFGWTVVNDPATGVRIGVPLKFASQVHNAKDGTLWSARHGEVEIETFRIKTVESLSKLFETRKQERGLKLESSYQHGNTFFVAGLLGLKQVATRAQLRDGELRGYTVRYDQAMEGIMLPVLPAIANAFAAFPGGAAPIAKLSLPVDYGTGIVVSATGYIVTDRRYADDCAIVTIPGLGHAERVASDGGLALLRVYGHDNLRPAALSNDGAVARDVTVIGIPDPRTQNGGGNSTAIKARLGDGQAVRLREPIPLAGFAGAPAFDGRGHVAGVLHMRNAMLASAGPAAAPIEMVPAATIREFLGGRKIALPADGGAQAGKDAVVRIICVRP
jgi:hypothetical protein